LNTIVASKEYTKKQKKELVVRVTNFSLISWDLYKMGPDEILHRYVPDHERHSILVKVHGGVTRGHYIGKTTTHKILRAGLWWPILHKDSKDYCSACKICQRMERPSHRDEFPLNPQVILQPFDKWVIDFLGLINPHGKKTSVHYIITAMNYLTRWAKAHLIKDFKIDIVFRFVFEYILSRFVCLDIPMSDRGTHFIKNMI